MTFWKQFFFEYFVSPHCLKPQVAQDDLLKWDMSLFSFLALFCLFCGPKEAKEAKKAKKNFFLDSEARWFTTTRGHIAYVKENLKKWYFSSLSVPFRPFLALFWSKRVKMIQNYFFLNSDAKWFPTRGHMPMFEQNLKKWYFRSQNGLSGPKKAKKWLFSKNEKNVRRKYSNL